MQEVIDRENWFTIRFYLKADDVNEPYEMDFECKEIIRIRDGNPEYDTFGDPSFEKASAIAEGTIGSTGDLKISIQVEFPEHSNMLQKIIDCIYDTANDWMPGNEQYLKRNN